MAKKVKLTQGGVVAYPITITDAIVDTSTSQKLSEIIASIGTQAEGWKLVQDAENSLTYHLQDSAGTNHGTINIPQDTFLAGAAFNGQTNKLVLTFNTASGKEAVDVDLSALVDTYTAGDGLEVTDKKFDIVIKSGEKFLEVTAEGLATKGIEDAIASLNTADQTNANAISALSGIVGTQSDAGATGETATAFGRIKNLESVVADLTGSGDGEVVSVESQINNAIDALKGDMESATIGAVEDTVSEVKATADSAVQEVEVVNNAAAGKSTLLTVAKNGTKVTISDDNLMSRLTTMDNEIAGRVTGIDIVNSEAEAQSELLTCGENNGLVTIDDSKLAAKLAGMNTAIDDKGKAIDALEASIDAGVKGELGSVEYEDVSAIALA